MVVDNEVLIALVFDKPALWDKKHKFHSKRNINDKCWKEISLEMKQDENKLRKRWRYLRDQFAVEYGKIPPSSSGDVAFYPKWPYFKALLFLKDVVRPRATTRNLSRRNVASTVHAGQDADTMDSPSAHDFTPPPSQRYQGGDNDSGQLAASPSCQKGPKNSYCDEKISNIEQQELHLLREKEKSRQRQNRPNEDDENLLFFKSLLPHVSKIPQHKLLSFRSRIQDVVEEFAYRTQYDNLSYSSMSNYSNLSGNSRQSSPETYRQNHSIVIAKMSGD